MPSLVCDTTSPFFKKGIIKTFESTNKEGKLKLKEAVEIFEIPNQHLEEISRTGSIASLALYNAPISESYKNSFRLHAFLKVSWNNLKLYHLATLPPTSDAARQHFYRVYFQGQQWLSNESINPEDWGWKERDILLLKNNSETFSRFTFRNDFFRCTKVCEGKAGSCRKVGQFCIALCKSCWMIFMKTLLYAATWLGMLIQYLRNKLINLRVYDPAVSLQCSLWYTNDLFNIFLLSLATYVIITRACLLHNVTNTTE